MHTRASERDDRARTAPPGFTLIELVLVTAVVGILAMLAYPKVDVTQFQMDSGARVVPIVRLTARSTSLRRGAT